MSSSQRVEGYNMLAQQFKDTTIFMLSESRANADSLLKAALLYKYSTDYIYLLA